MKPANGFGLALAMAAMVAAMAQTAAASGSIRSITACDPETGHREYGPNDPVRIGEALAFKVRLLNFNTNCTSTGGTDNPWRFRPRPGVDEALAAANPPAMGLWIGGRKRCATIRSVQPSLSYYTDLVFEYVVQSGDQAQPVRFCNVDGSGPLADSAGQLYPLENVGPGSCWVLTDEATGTSCEFSFGSLALVPSSNDGFAYPPAGWSASGEVRDYDLSRAGIYVNGFKDIAATVTGCAVVYDGQGHGVMVAVSDPDVGAALRFALGTLSGPTDAWSATAPMFTNACDATVWVEISAEGYATVTNHADVTITNAPLTIAAKDQTYAYNGQSQGEGDTAYATPDDIAEKVAVSGLAPGDGLASIILDGQGTAPGTYPIVPSNATVTNAVGANVTDNYAIGYTNGTLTIREPPPPFVSNVVARQRWPWNGLVDVDYEVGGYTEGLEVRISFAKQGDEGRPRVATRFLAGTEPSAVPGRHRATWDAAADGAANFVASNLVATVALVEPDVWLLPRTYELYNGDIYLDGYKVRSADDVDTNLIVAPGDSCTCLLISSYEDANGDTRYKQIEAKPAVAVESDEKDMFTTVADAGQVTVTVNDGAPIGPSAAISCSLAGCRMRNSLTVSTGAMRGIKLYLPESGRPQRYDENAWDVYARVVPFADNSREVEAGATYQKATLSNDKLDELLVRDFSYVQDGNTFVQDMYRLEASVPISAEKVLVLFELRAKNAAAGDWGFVMPAYMIDLAKPLYEEDRNYTENDYVPYDADYFFPLWTAEFNTNQTPFGTYKGNAKTKAFKVGDGVGFHTGRMTGSEGSGQGLWTIGVSHVRPLDAAVIEGGLDDGNMKAAGTGETCLLGSWYGVEGIVYPIHFTELSTNPSTYSAEPTLLSVTE